MKTIKEYITESVELSDTAKQKIDFKDTLLKFLNQREKQFSLNNKTHMKELFNGYMSFIETNKMFQSMSYVKRNHIRNEEMFKCLLIDSAKYLCNTVNIGKYIKDFDISEQEKEYLKYKESSEYQAPISAEDAKKYEDRVLTIYDRYNPSDCQHYPFSGKRGKDTEHYVNMCRTDFHYSTGCNYYNCYPCMYIYYMSHGKDLEHYVDTISEDDSK